jgi:hypothetical protein
VRDAGLHHKQTQVSRPRAVGGREGQQASGDAALPSEERSPSTGRVKDKTRQDKAQSLQNDPCEAARCCPCLSRLQAAHSAEAEGTHMGTDLICPYLICASGPMYYCQEGRCVGCAQRAARRLGAQPVLCAAEAMCLLEAVDITKPCQSLCTLL